MNKLQTKLNDLLSRRIEQEDSWLDHKLQTYEQELIETHKREVHYLQMVTSIIITILDSYGEGWEHTHSRQCDTFRSKGGKLSVFLENIKTGACEAYYIYGHNIRHLAVYKVVDGKKIGKKRFNTLEDLLLQDFREVEWEEW